MANVDILVPGTAGTTLLRSDGSDTGYPAGMLLESVADTLLFGRQPSDLIPLLSMAHVVGQLAPQRTSLAPNESLRPGSVLAAAYNQVPSSYIRWVYDWRADLRWNADNLLTFLTTQQPLGGRWNILAHSQGCLLVVLASKLARDRGASFDDLAASATLVAGPYAGTINAARALLTGAGMTSAVAPTFQAIMRTWPSLYQMMPRWPAVADPSGSYVTVAQLTEPACWAGEAGTVSDFLTRTIDVQEQLVNSFEAFGAGTRLAIYMAMNNETSTGYTRMQDGTLSENPALLMPGDTLVPESLTASFIGMNYLPYIRRFNGAINVHSMLLNDSTVMKAAVQERVP